MQVDNGSVGLPRLRYAYRVHGPEERGMRIGGGLHLTYKVHTYRGLVYLYPPIQPPLLAPHSYAD